MIRVEVSIEVRIEVKVEDGIKLRIYVRAGYQAVYSKPRYYWKRDSRAQRYDIFRAVPSSLHGPLLSYQRMEDFRPGIGRHKRPGLATTRRFME